MFRPFFYYTYANVLVFFEYCNLPTCPHYVSICLNISQNVSICLNLHFWAILNNFEQFWADLGATKFDDVILSNLEQFRAILSNFWADLGATNWVNQFIYYLKTSTIWTPTIWTWMELILSNLLFHCRHWPGLTSSSQPATQSSILTWILSTLQSGHPASSAAACLRRITPRSHRRQVAAQWQRTT